MQFIFSFHLEVALIFMLFSFYLLFLQLLNVKFLFAILTIAQRQRAVGCEGSRHLQ